MKVHPITEERGRPGKEINIMGKEKGKKASVSVEKKIGKTRSDYLE